MADILFKSASNSGYQSDTGDLSWFHPAHEGDYVIVSVSFFAPTEVLENPDPYGIVCGGTPLVLIHEWNVSLSEDLAAVAQIWGAPIARSEEAVQIVATLAGLNFDGVAFATVLSVVDPVSPVIMFDHASGTGSPAEIVLDVGTDPGYWVVDSVTTSDTSITVGADQIQRGNVSGALGSGGQSTETGDDPTAMSWTGVTGPWVMCAVALRPAVATAYTLPASAGAFALTGTAATLRTARKLTAGSGAFVLTGTAAGLRVARTMPAASGTFSIERPPDDATSLRVGRKIAAAAGAFALAGQTAALKIGLRIAAAAGSFALAGQAATFRFTRVLTAASGAFALVGQEVVFMLPLVLGAASGAFVFAGQAVTLAWRHMLQAATGLFVLAGQWAWLNREKHTKGEKVVLEPSPECCCHDGGCLVCTCTLPPFHYKVTVASITFNCGGGVFETINFSPALCVDFFLDAADCAAGIQAPANSVSGAFTLCGTPGLTATLSAIPACDLVDGVYHLGVVLTCFLSVGFPCAINQRALIGTATSGTPTPICDPSTMLGTLAGIDGSTPPCGISGNFVVTDASC